MHPSTSSTGDNMVRRLPALGALAAITLLLCGCVQSEQSAPSEPSLSAPTTATPSPSPTSIPEPPTDEATRGTQAPEDAPSINDEEAKALAADACTTLKQSNFAVAKIDSALATSLTQADAASSLDSKWSTLRDGIRGYTNAFRDQNSELMSTSLASMQAECRALGIEIISA